MRQWAFLFRFFLVVTPVPLLVIVLAVVATSVSIVLASVTPSGASIALPSLLVLQIFAASSGAVIPARRGYYDTLLARGVGRAQLLCGHWLASVGPGLVCWCVVALLEAVTRGADLAVPGRALTSGSLVALWLASTLPWAATVGLPRFAAAIAWLVVLVTSLATVPLGQATLIAVVDGRRGEPWAWVAALVYPMGLIGEPLTAGQWRMVWPGLVLSLSAPAAAFVWFCRADIPLEAAQ